MFEFILEIYFQYFSFRQYYMEKKENKTHVRTHLLDDLGTSQPQSQK